MSEPEKKPSDLDAYIWILVCLFAGVIMATIAIPNFIKARSQSATNPCINNLRQIDAAANQFALEHGLKTGTPIYFPNDLTAYIKLNSAGKIPTCPDGGIYTLEKVGDMPTCSQATNGMPWHILP